MTRAVRFDTPGPPAVLTLRTVAKPSIRADEVLVDIKAAAVNHLDLDERAGVSGFAVTETGQLGREGAGVVTEVGEAVTGWAIGDRVVVSAYPPCGACQYCRLGLINICANPRRPGIDVPGTYADQLAVPANGLFPLPAGVDFDAGACLQLTFGTAWHGLLTRAQLRPSESILVTGAGGGVGSAAVQVARLAGAHVIAAASSDRGRELASRCGADATIDSRTIDTLLEGVRAETAGTGVDVIFDAAAGEVMAHAAEGLKPGGRYVLYGAHGGESVTLDAIGVFRRYMHIIATRGWLLSDMDAVLAAAADQRIHVPIHQRLPLPAAAAAHEALAARRVAGKVVLIP